MKALRRSIKGEKTESRPPLINIPTKSAFAIVPPKKVIRALHDYEAQSSQELSFSRGDFFHVIGRENDPNWYEACNPAVPDAVGLVPVNFFQSLGKTERDSGQSDGSKMSTKSPDHDSGYSDTPASTSLDQARAMKMPMKTGAMVYGMVMYDFAAERPDELDAKAGEAIIVIAQSNPEWFVAKPIGRLGGPGLIPVSFTEIRDMTTGLPVPDALEAVQRAGVPKVEEWKKMTEVYKNSSISLGKFEAGNQQQLQQMQAHSRQQSMEQGMNRLSLQQQAARQSQNGQTMSQQQRARQSDQVRAAQAVPQQPVYQPQTGSQLFSPIRAHIPRYCFAQGKYWFVIEAELEDGRHWELSRYYEDFYDFQIALLTEFPDEAGNTGKQKRTLPYMPGPVNYVTDAITDGRRHNLDAYVKNLLAQPPYIAKCLLVKRFFAPREGDFEIDPSIIGEEYRLSQGSQLSAGTPDVPSAQSSSANLNGNDYPSLSAPPHQVHQRAQPSLSDGQGFRPEMNRQPSAMSQPSTTSLSGMGQALQAPAAMKVKIYYGDDLIAIRVPSDIQFQALCDKIQDRLKIAPGEEMALTYKDEASGERPNLMSNNDLDFALQRNDKLILYVNYN